jgi:sec-independent protein translocase protein TatA
MLTLASMFGMNDWVIILVMVLLLFGGKKIPELMRGVGKGVGELQKGLHEGKQHLEQAINEEPARQYTPPIGEVQPREVPKAGPTGTTPTV